MPSTKNQPTDSASETTHHADRRRRSFLLLFPAGIIAAIGATLFTTALRFLRPSVVSGATTEDGGARWLPLAPVAQLTGSDPLLREVTIERRAGWTNGRDGRAVYVLPYLNNRVVSPVCPHEACEVGWRSAERVFICPCHDSRFNADGEVLNGPARQNLQQIPSRVENGVLEVRYAQAATSAEQRAAVRG